MDGGEYLELYDESNHPLSAPTVGRAAFPSGNGRAADSGLPQTGPVIAGQEVSFGNMPELPENVALDPSIGIGAGSWIDDYINYARCVSPMTPDLFHESAALVLGGIAIARRLVLKMPFGNIFPNLFVLWIAITTLFRKTTSLDLSRQLARHVFQFLLAAQDTTPEAFLSDLAGKEPTGWDKMTQSEQAGWNDQKNYSAQQGWVLDEASGLLAGFGRDYNAGLLETLMRLYDCEPYFRRSTRGQGIITVRNSYLSLLGASTPAALAEHLTKDILWNNGFWPRFVLLTPEISRPKWAEPKDTEQPAALADGLDGLFNRLPPVKWPNPPEPRTVSLAPDVMKAWKKYNKVLSYDLLTDGLDNRLFAAYGRLPTQCLKVGMILSAFDWDGKAAPQIELPHFARAQEITETWRASVHRTLEAAVESGITRLEKRLIRLITLSGPNGISLRDLCKALKDKQPSEIEAALYELERGGIIEMFETKPGKEGGRPTKKWRMV